MRGHIPVLIAAVAGGLALAWPGSALAAPTATGAGDSGLPTFVDTGSSYYSDAAVNVANGDLLVTAKDGAQAAGASSSLPFTRYYNSQTGTNSTLGLGWSLSVGPDVNLVISANKIVAHMPSGATATFTANTDGTYSSTGTDANLVKTGAQYVLTDTFGTADTFDSQGTLTSVQGSSSTNPAAVYDSVVAGKSAPLLDDVIDSQDDASLQAGYSVGGQLITVYDASGGQSSYAYTANGQLASYTNPSGVSTRYGYNSYNVLTSITEADGTIETVSYVGTAVSKLSVSPAGGGAAYGYTFSYTSPDPSLCGANDVGETIATPINSADGSAMTYCYTAAGLVDATSTSDLGSTAGVNYNTPGGGSPAPPPPLGQGSALSLSPAVTAINWHVFNIKEHHYIWDPKSIVAWAGTQITTQQNPTNFAWGFELNPSLRTVTTGTVQPQAFGYNYTTGARLLVNGTPYAALGKAESPYYFFHGTMPGIGDGQTYQLAVNIVGQPCSKFEGCLYNAWQRWNFRVVK